MTAAEIVVQGIRVPGIMYGTAWKEERTEPLVRQALAAGFRAVDTANQRKHYHEAAVGDALRAAGAPPRAELFLQTKFTYRRGQDHRLPYDPGAPLAQQVEQSFESSLEHLGTDVIDSYVLHGPWSGGGVVAQDREVWRAMEALQRAGRTRLIGLSNVSAEQLAGFLELAEVPPAFVQNRCYASLGWDGEVRARCRAHGVVYQGFSLLTANRRELAAPELRALARRRGVTPAQLVFAFAAGAGMLPLTGTADQAHLREDLAALALSLSPAELAMIERIGAA